MSAAMPIGMAITTVASTDGMAGARSTTHGTILHGMVLAIGMTHGITGLITHIIAIIGDLAITHIRAILTIREAA